MIPKFRLFDKRFRLMLEVHVIDFYERTIDCYVDDLGVNRQEVYSYEMNEDNYELMQSTGLTDKNGKEIYEGDIFKAPFDIGPAGFSMSKGVVEYDLEQGYQWEYLLLSEMEIIGNIYENPEILK